MDEFIDYKCIDFKKLLLVKGKQLKIPDQEMYILFLIMFMEEMGIQTITPSSIHEYCAMSIQKIDSILISLLDKQIISRVQGRLDLKPLYQLLLNQKIKQEKPVDLISIFENAFGRSLNQAELSIIQSFKTSGFDDSMIVDALNESVKSGVINFRYIEKILDNWSKFGVNKRFAPVRQQTSSKVEQNIKDYKWWEGHE